MLGNTNLNVTQSINSFIRPLGLSLSNKKQMLAKVTTVALAAILIFGNLSSVSADCVSDCIDKCPRCCSGSLGVCPPCAICVKGCYDRCRAG
ncbi:MAG: hypothetical protein ACRDAI_00695 [Candidatus Rhabdochlamydia sp.]